MPEVKMIEVKEVSYSYNGKKALDKISFETENEFVAIMGPNGSGKSTLVKLIVGMLKPDEGSIKVFGMEPENARDLIGYMPQRETIAKHFPIRVKDIMIMGASSRRFPTREEMGNAMEALQKIGLEHLWEKRFSALSQGQQQRIMFARALAKKPRLLILDEPFNAVDVPSRNMMVEILKEERKKGTEIIVVVHNINPILHQIEKVVLLNRKCIAWGKPAHVLTPENLKETYGADIQIVRCEEGYCHPLIGDEHAG